MTSVQVTDLKGKKVGDKELRADVFDIEPNMHVIHGALHRQLTNARSGSANCKTRSEVRGGGRKPWKQKGTGRARAGSIRSPLWAGGGVIFGPKPRDYSQSMPKKARQLAMKSVLAARKEDMIVVKDFLGLFKAAPGSDKAVEQPKTKAFLQVLKDLGIAAKAVLVIIDNKLPGALQIERAARNIDSVRVIYASNLSVKDMAFCDHILTTEHVIQQIEDRFEVSEPKSPAANDAVEPTERAKTKSKVAAPEKAGAGHGKEKKSDSSKADSVKPANEKKPAAKPRKKAEGDK